MKSEGRSWHGDAASWAFVAIGSNLGESVELVRQALRQLQTLTDVPLLRSSLWRTQPVDCPPGSPTFVNAVAGLQLPAGATPENLLGRLQQIEREFGRRAKTVMNEPRPLDLDLLAFGSEQRSTEALVLPHPRAHLRRFVLAPWAEIAPEFLLPGQTRPVAELLALLAEDQTVERISG